MGAVRRTFPTPERNVIVPGKVVQWLDKTHWKSARVTSEIITDGDGYQYAMAVNLTGTRTISRGDTITLTPKHVRAVALPLGDWLAIQGHREASNMAAEDVPADLRAAYEASPEGRRHAEMAR